MCQTTKGESMQGHLKNKQGLQEVLKMCAHVTVYEFKLLNVSRKDKSLIG